MNERIKQIRKDKGLNQEDFGKRLGVTKTAISKMELGTYNVTDTMLKLICSEFNISEEWLRSGDGQMFEQQTEQQKLMKYTALLLKDTDSIIAEAIKAFIITYEQLDETNKASLEKVMHKYMDNLKKGQ